MSMRYLNAGIGLLCLTGGVARANEATEQGHAYDLTIEQLFNVEVTSVSRRAEPLVEASASVEVISNADIRRSGAQSLPEILRRARNLEVAQIDAQRYAISARGFNSYEASNKLLVLIDGRSVYTPLYSGVFWDQLHVPLRDIDRIEVISGPGGTLWGANAVNGVINIITKDARESEGFSGDIFAGDVDRRADLRFGGAFGETGAFRVFASAFDLGSTLMLNGDEAGDGGNGVQGGFRADWGGMEQRFMAQGAIYSDKIDAGGRREGGHLLARWRALLGDGSAIEAQAYYSQEERDAALRAAPGIFDASESLDFSLQHNVRSGPHEVVWGAGYRRVNSEFVNTLNPAGFAQPRRTLETFNLFVQDQIALSDELVLTLGVKLEDDTFAGLEYMPNVRLAWRPGEEFMVWGAISRAVRTPSRIDYELEIPGFSVAGRFQSEELLAYELGARARPSVNAAVSATFFWHEYDQLRTASLSPPGVLPAFVGNGLRGDVYGVELTGDVALSEDWRLSVGLTLLEQDFQTDPLSFDVNGSGDDPGYQVFLRADADLSDAVAFNVELRAIDEVNPSVPAYVELNARLAWRVNGRVEIALSGRNLLDEAHPESFDAAPLLQARRAFQLGAHLTY